MSFYGKSATARSLIAGELTKVHEELVRGPYSDSARPSIREGRGEFTVVVELVGHTQQKSIAPSAASDRS